MDFAPLLSRSTDRFRELEAEIASGNLYADPRRARDLLREHTRLKALIADWDNLQKSRADLASNQQLANGDDAEMAEMAAAEIPELEKLIAALEEKVQFALLPPDPNEERDAIVEIRAGTGGDEAGLFAGEIGRASCRERV